MKWLCNMINLRVDPANVFEVWNPSENWSTHMHMVFSWSIEVQSKIWARECDGFCFEVCLNAVQSAAPQSNSSCLEISHFRKMATGSVEKLEKLFFNIYLYFQQNCWRNNLFFKESSGVIRTEMHWLIFFVSTFDICHLDVLDPVVRIYISLKV